MAGTIGAITNNNFSVAGVAGGFAGGTTSSPANGAKIMPLRIGYRARFRGQITGIVRMDWAAEAMDYISDMIDRNGINVVAINCSWSSSNSGGINAAVDNLLAHDVMIIHAAGNDNSSAADFLGQKAGVMNVAATDNSGAGASFTNNGSWVDLAAPGVDIVSTYTDPTDPDPNNHYVALLSGTSMAAPHACGVAALLESFDPTLSGPDKFSLMVNNTTAYSDSRDLGSGILNAYLALLAVPTAPPAPTGVSVSVGPPCDGVVVSWNAAPGADGYIIGYQEGVPGPPYNPTVDGNPASGSDLGNVTQISINGLTATETYYFSCIAYNSVGQSGFSEPNSVLVGSHCSVEISGSLLTITGNPIAGVLVTADNGGGSDLSDPNGNYSVTVPWGWLNGVITPGKTRWSFDPNQVTYPGPVTFDKINEDYVGRAWADFNLSGLVDGADLVRFVGNWLRDDCAAPDHCESVDLDLSGNVDMTDWNLLVPRWLKPN